MASAGMAIQSAKRNDISISICKSAFQAVSWSLAPIRV
jgi:hypothetical protein